MGEREDNNNPIEEKQHEELRDKIKELEDKLK